MKIREAHISETTVLSDLALKSKAYWGYTNEFIKPCLDELNVTAEDINSSTMSYQVCEVQETIIGFYAIEHLTKDEAELEALFVRPEYIGKGVGKFLIQHAIYFAREQGYKLLIIQGDPNAENFYLTMGAKPVGKMQSASIKDRYLPLFHLYLD